MTEYPFRFGTKAETLSRLGSALNLSSILPSYYFNIGEWDKNSEQILQKIVDFANAKPLIIRSSAQNEDGNLNSMAGAFESCLNVSSNDHSQIQNAIESVINSYGSESQNDDQILIPDLFIYYLSVSSSNILILNSGVDNTVFFCSLT